MTLGIPENHFNKMVEWLEAGKYISVAPLNPTDERTVLLSYDSENNKAVVSDLNFNVKETEQLGAAGARSVIFDFATITRREDDDLEGSFYFFQGFDVDFVEVENGKVTAPYYGSIKRAYESLQNLSKETKETKERRYIMNSIEKVQEIQNLKFEVDTLITHIKNSEVIGTENKKFQINQLRIIRESMNKDLTEHLDKSIQETIENANQGG